MKKKAKDLKWESEKRRNTISKEMDQIKKEQRLDKMERTVSVAYSANQFIIRFPKEISEYLKLTDKKKYKAKLTLSFNQKNKIDMEIVENGSS